MASAFHHSPGACLCRSGYLLGGSDCGEAEAGAGAALARLGGLDGEGALPLFAAVAGAAGGEGGGSDFTLGDEGALGLPEGGT